MTEEKCPKCGIGKLHSLETLIKRCKYCDSYFKKGSEVIFTESGSLIYLDRQYKQSNPLKINKWNKGKVATKGHAVNIVRQLLKPLKQKNELITIILDGEIITAYFTNFKELNAAIRDEKNQYKNVAEKAEILRSTLGAYSRGARPPTAEHIEKLIDVLGNKSKPAFRIKKYYMRDVLAGEIAEVEE